MEGLKYNIQQAEGILTDFIHCFWQLENCSSEKRVVTVLPDGYFDILFFSINNRPFTASLLGLSTTSTNYTLPKNAVVFAVSFKLLAVDYLLRINISSLLNNRKRLNNNFWNINQIEFPGLDAFAKIVTSKMTDSIDQKIEERKRTLFNELYSTNGSKKVDELSTELFWNSRQINRYFKSRFGISLKGYCNILRFRASFSHLKEGKLFPEQDYFDQAHFIKEVRKFSATSPKFLAENKNDRFIQLSTLSKK